MGASVSCGHIFPFYIFFCQVKHIHSIVLLELVIYVIHIFDIIMLFLMSVIFTVLSCLIKHAKILSTPQIKWQYLNTIDYLIYIFSSYLLSDLSFFVDMVMFAGRSEKMWNIFLHCRQWGFCVFIQIITAIYMYMYVKVLIWGLFWWKKNIKIKYE